ncbi:MAG: hypothetical protein ABI877_08815 [Gemmatimonadaceae bacterium]
MSDLMLFIVLFGSLFVLRVVAATVIFLAMLPEGDRCPNCDHATMRLASPFSDRLLPWLRKRWCLACGWEGMLRRGPLTKAEFTADQLTKHR